MPCTGVHHLQGLPVRAGRGPGSPRLPGHPAAARHRLRRPRARALAGGEQDAAGLRSQRAAAAGDLEGAGGVPQARVHSFWPGRGTSGSIYKDDDSFLIRGIPLVLIQCLTIGRMVCVIPTSTGPPLLTLLPERVCGMTLDHSMSCLRN